MVVREHSKANINTEKELKNSSVPSPVVHKNCSPRYLPLMRSETRNDVPYGPPMAVTSTPPQPLEGKWPLRSKRSEMCQNDAFTSGRSVANVLAPGYNEHHGSVKDNISEQWTVPLALSPTIPVTNLPVSRTQRHSEMRNIPSYGHPLAVSLDNPRPMCLGTCSLSERVNKRRTVLTAPFSAGQMSYTPVSRQQSVGSEWARRPKKSKARRNSVFI